MVFNLFELNCIDTELPPNPLGPKKILVDDFVESWSLCDITKLHNQATLPLFSGVTGEHTISDHCFVQGKAGWYGSWHSLMGRSPGL